MLTSPRRPRQKKRHGVTSLAGGGDSVSNISNEVSHGAFDDFLESMMGGNDTNLGVEEKGDNNNAKIDHTENSMFYEGKEFIDWVEFMQTKEAFEKVNFVSICSEQAHKQKNETIYDSKLRPYARVNFGCYHGKHRSTRGQNIYNRKTCKLNCPFSLRISYNSVKNVYVVRSLNLQHNHVLDKRYHSRHPQNRTLNDMQVDEIKPYIDQEIPVKKLHAIAQAKFDKPITVKDMANLVQREKNNTGSDIKALESIVHEIRSCDPQCFIEILAFDDSDKLEGVYFQYSKMKSVLQTFGHMVFVDVTYNVNLEGYHLMTFLIADGDNNGQPVGYAYINNESKPVLHLVLQAFVKSLKLSNRETVDIFMVDKDMKCISSLREFFKDSQILLCYFHVMKHFKEKINRDVTGSNDYKDSVLQQIRSIITSNTLEQYQANFEKLENIAPGKFIDYYQKNWEGDIKVWFVLYERRSLFYVGNDTNNLIESHHRVIKKDLKRTHHLPHSIKVLFDSYNHRFMEKAHKTHIDIKMKRPMNQSAHAFLKQYYELCTEFAFKLIKRQLDIFQILQVGGYNVETKIGYPDMLVILDHQRKPYNVCLRKWTCDCSFFKNFHLCCQHIFKARSVKKLSLYCQESVHSRYFNTTAESIFELDVKEDNPNYVPSGFDIRQSKLHSASDRFNYCKGIMNNICDVSSDLPPAKFKHIMNHLENFYHMILAGDFNGIKKLSPPNDNLESSAENQLEKEQSSAEKVFVIDNLNLHVPKAKKRPKRKRITFKTKVKNKASESSKYLADVPSLNLDHSYVTQPLDAKILPGTPIVLTNENVLSNNKNDRLEPTCTFMDISVEKTNISNELVADSSSDSEPEVVKDKHARHFPDLKGRPSIPFTYMDNLYEKYLPESKNILNPSYWLTGDDINAFQYLLSKHERFANLDGLQDVLTFPSSRPLAGACEKKFIQIVNVRNSHWITLSNVFTTRANGDEVCVYDSMRPSKFDPALKTLASSMLRKEKFYLTAVEVSKQDGGNDCGLFACAFATSLLLGHNPISFDYTQQNLRKHFMRCIDLRSVVSFPSSFMKTRKCKSAERFSVEVETFCHCRLADVEISLNIRMVQCNRCDVFYHETCIVQPIPEVVWNDENIEYICPNCS